MVERKHVRDSNSQNVNFSPEEKTQDAKGLDLFQSFLLSKWKNFHKKYKEIAKLYI